MSYELTPLDVQILRECAHFVTDQASPKLWREFEALMERVKMAGL